jgi:hypothetical protein
MIFTVTVAGFLFFVVADVFAGRNQKYRHGGALTTVTGPIRNNSSQGPLPL